MPKARVTASPHGEKGLVHALFGSAQSILDRGKWIVGTFGLGTFGAWIISAAQDNAQALLAADKYFWQGCVILYFTSWVAGVQLDKTNQERVYTGAPDQVKVTPAALGIASLIFALFALMFVCVSFAVIEPHAKPLPPLSLLQFIKPGQGLTAFVVCLILWFLNIPMWRYYVNSYIDPIEHRSRGICRAQNDYIGLIKIDIITDYIKGRWQWYRYIVGALLLFGCDALVWTYRASGDVKLVVALATGGFLAVVESWMWSMRLKVDHSIGCIDSLARDYHLAPRHGRAGAPATRKKPP